MRLLLGLIVLTLATLAVFALWPGIDLYVAGLFYGENGFIGHESFERAIRAFFNITPFLALAAFAGAYAMRRFGFEVPYAPTGRQMAFLIATMAIGPGLIVNLGLKDNTHRPRPAHTRDFGGSDEFRPWYRFDGECRRNCSFVSGEGAEAFWMVAPASLAPIQERPLLIAGALLFGALTSLLRMAFGGHYLSDVLLAGLLMLILVQGARLWLLRPRDP
jgi:membrane-associated phospholipid phosphatase